MRLREGGKVTSICYMPILYQLFMCIIHLILSVASKVNFMLAFGKGDFPKILLLQSGEARTGTQVCGSLKLIVFHHTFGFRNYISLVNDLGVPSLALLLAAGEEKISWNRYTSHTLSLEPSGGGPALAFTI